MFCPQCGNKVEQNESYCTKCGNFLKQENLNNLSSVNISPTNQHSSQNTNYNQSISNNPTNRKKIFIGIASGIGVLIIIFISTFVIKIQKEQYYFSTNNQDNQEETSQSTTTKKKGKYSTIIITDNTYSGVKISTTKDANDLIIKDSVSQKNNCPQEIETIENEIINTYGITAVNLCEMDPNFAKEISNVFGKIYKEYPSVRGYLTNLSLINASLSDGYIAAFMPIFSFATSDTKTTYPWIIKTQVLLNTTYFLNTTRLESSVKDGSNSGHFPPNSTMYSPVAHELGHYLSFLAMMKNHNSNSILIIDNNNIETLYEIYADFCEGTYSLEMITEAYNNYKNEIGTNLDIDTWRSQISAYAVAKDNNGNYIYDETIAEAFHDVYLNEDQANTVSKYVVNVLKSKLEG